MTWTKYGLVFIIQLDIENLLQHFEQVVLSANVLEDQMMPKLYQQIETASKLRQ